MAKAGKASSLVPELTALQTAICTSQFLARRSTYVPGNKVIEGEAARASMRYKC